MMRFILVLVGVFAGGAALARSKTQALTFAEFRALAPEERAQYIETMREFALSLEKSSGGREQAADLSVPASLNLWAALLCPRASAIPGEPCVVAGYISTFNANDRCPVPARQSWTIATPDGSTVTQTMCTGAGQTLCNPTLYGFGSYSGGSYSGICTSSRSSPTADCEKQYHALPNYPASKVAEQLVKSNLDKQFDATSQKITSYCAKPDNRQSSVCKTVVHRSDFLKSRVAAAAAEKAKKDAEKKTADKEAADKKAKEAADKQTADAKASAAAAADKPKASTTTASAASAGAEGAAPTPTSSGAGTASRGLESNPSPAPAANAESAAPAAAPSSEKAAPAAAAPPRPPETVPPGQSDEAKAAEAKAAEEKKKKEDAAKAAEAKKKKEEETPANCMANVKDYNERKAKFPNLPQRIPASFVMDNQVAWVAIQLREVGGRLKQETYVWYAGKIMMKTAYVTSLCYNASTHDYTMKFASGKSTKMNFSPTGIILEDNEISNGTSAAFEQVAAKIRQGAQTNQAPVVDSMDGHQ